VAVWLFSVWLANPLFWLGLFWCIRGHTVRSTTAGLLSVALGLSILPLAREAHLGWPGYWLWLASFLVLFVGSPLCRPSVVRSPITLVPNPGIRP
jgi:hypothetical protein